MKFGKAENLTGNLKPFKMEKYLLDTNIIIFYLKDAVSKPTFKDRIVY